MITREESIANMLNTMVISVRAKLMAKKYKKPITDLTLPEALKLYAREEEELKEELRKPELDYRAIELEIDDMVALLGAAIVDCQRMRFKKTLMEAVLQDKGKN